jgi:hypothetical protein
MCLLQRAALYFLGGADDREALAYAARMPETGTMSLTVVRFKLRNWVGMGGRDEARDEELLQEFWSRHRDNERGGVHGEDGGGRGGHDVRGARHEREVRPAHRESLSLCLGVGASEEGEGEE